MNDPAKVSENYKIKEQVKETYLLLVHTNTISLTGEHFLRVIMKGFQNHDMMVVSDILLPFV